jgi:hypothetical protein
VSPDMDGFSEKLGERGEIYDTITGHVGVVGGVGGVGQPSNWHGTPLEHGSSRRHPRLVPLLALVLLVSN